ncbi:NEL-type E3 ubiquitin ligase domain-containing protein [Pseudomonas pudica]|uniref:NEL-type E3 ubiquitin ligase domain-containing protein n=1 Tax=Pseudomonas pudica TaxID=272772 RepID=UPI00228737BA|nr:NEL-type E3 ubiquitin ligase domain-containing protein [Pseudomonas pudica]
MADFAQSEDFEAHPRHYRRRIWHILEACENNEALREQLFREADGPRTCEDRLLLLLNQMEVGVLALSGHRRRAGCNEREPPAVSGRPVAPPGPA